MRLATYAEALAAHHGFPIGCTVIDHRDARHVIARAEVVLTGDVASDSCSVYGRKIRKDGTPGKAVQYISRISVSHPRIRRVDD